MLVKKEICRLIKKVCVFSSLILFVLYGVSLFDNICLDNRAYYSKNNSVLKIQNLKNIDRLDILFIGNSYTYSGIKPSSFDKLGLNAYNIGVQTAGLEFYDLILQDILTQKKDIKVVFLLVSPSTFVNKSDNYKTLPLHRYLLKPKSTILAMFKYEKLRDHSIMVFRYSIKMGIKNLILYFKSLFIKKNNEYPKILVNKGWEQSEQVVDSKIISSTKKYYLDLESQFFDSNKIQILMNLAEQLKSKNITPVFHTLPTNSLKDYFNKDFLKQYNIGVNNLRNMYYFLDLDKKINKKNFRNIDHLNSFGAELVTEQILEYVSGLPQLKLNE